MRKTKRNECGIGLDRCQIQSPAISKFGREILAGSPRQQRVWIDLAVQFWRAEGFPYPRLNDEEVAREFRRLERLDISNVFRRDRLYPSTIGLRLANAFHPQIWSIPARRHRCAPIDHFNNDSTLQKLLWRAATFWPNRRCWNGQCLRAMLRIYAGGRVSNFRPAVSRAIVARFSSAGQTVLDFSAGFGGRLLGCLTLNRQYIGVEPAKAQISGLRKMVDSLAHLSSAHISLHQQCAEDAMQRFSKSSVDLVFSSPPYFDVERYSTDKTQSYQRFKTYTAWKQGFLEPILAGSYRVLRPGGRLVVNVANTPTYPIAEDFERAAKRLFRSEASLRLLMHSRPLQRSAGMKAFRWEPVLVFRRN